MLNCWRLNESWIVDITKLFIQKVTAVYGMKGFLKLGGDECNNLNFIILKMTVLKLVKICEY